MPAQSDHLHPHDAHVHQAAGPDAKRPARSSRRGLGGHAVSAGGLRACNRRQAVEQPNGHPSPCMAPALSVAGRTGAAPAGPGPLQQPALVDPRSAAAGTDGMMSAWAPATGSAAILPRLVRSKSPSMMETSVEVTPSQMSAISCADGSPLYGRLPRPPAGPDSNRRTALRSAGRSTQGQAIRFA